MAVADEQLLLQVLPMLRPASWCGLRRLSAAACRAISKGLMEAAARRLPVVNSSDNICKELELYADGSTVVLLPGRHRWSGRLTLRRLRVFGLPGATIRGRVQLAEGSSGAFYDVDFTSGDGSAVRVQGASWSFHNCSVECTDQDASAVTVMSAQVLLRDCSVRGVDSGLIPKPCWIGVLVKGSAAVRAVSCRVGPCVQRGAVAIDAAELCLSNCHVHGCEEIGLRLDGSASLAADGTELEGGGVALHAGIACTGSLEMRNCRIVNFKALWGGDSRPLDLDLETTTVASLGENKLPDDDCSHPSVMRSGLVSFQWLSR